MSKDILYYHLESDYKGNRYFKVDWINRTCVQVVVHNGRTKKGKPNMIGVYNLSIASFVGNYYHFLKGQGTVLLKITTECQYLNGIREVLIKFT